MSRILGIDVGERRIGLALGETETKFAFTRPALVVSSWDEVWPAIKKLVTDEQVSVIIVGWPIRARGETGQQAERIDQFIDGLRMQVSVPIEKRNERETTKAARREQQSVGQSRPRAEIDSLAAQLLVESYLSESLR